MTYATDEETKTRILTQRRAGASYAEIADNLGVSYHVVRTTVLGGAPAGSRMNTPWKPADDDLLRKLVDDGTAVKDVAAKIGRTYDATRKRAEKLGVDVTRGARMEWTPENVARLKKLAFGKASVAEIADAFGASHNAIATKLAKLRLRSTTRTSEGQRWLIDEQLQMGTSIRRIAMKTGLPIEVVEAHVAWRSELLSEGRAA